MRKSVSIQPRKVTDRGGWLCMPLVVHTPEGKPGWEKIHCPVCGEEKGEEQHEKNNS